MLDGATAPLDLAAVHAGKQTPCFFGSAVNNFGVQLLLEGFLQKSIPPTARRSTSVTTPGAPAPTEERVVPIEHAKFSGFVFKIQANMDPKHRDRIAFIRVCSGKFERDMVVTHQRTGKQVRLSSAHRLFGQERETVDIAWPGDVIGLVGHDSFGIGDTLTEDRTIAFDEIPRFPSEVFAYIFNPTSSDAKKYRAGLEQLLQEGVVQSFMPRNAPPGATLLAAVGPLQFEVVQFRLESEYGATSRLEPAPWTVVRWLPPGLTEDQLDALTLPTGAKLAHDMGGHAVVLFTNEWSANYFTQPNPGVTLSALPLGTGEAR
jgi:peptide chain release factor 3